jgi:hypothetical protein
LATCLVGSNIIGHYTCILTNKAHELTLYRFGFNCFTKQFMKIFSVWAEIWTWISRMNDRCLSQLYDWDCLSFQVLQLTIIWRGVLLDDMLIVFQEEHLGTSRWVFGVLSFLALISRYELYYDLRFIKLYSRYFYCSISSSYINGESSSYTFKDFSPRIS